VIIEQFRQKTPLPCLLQGLLERCFSAEKLDALFERHAQTQYIREVTFATVCDLMLGVVLKIHPTVHAAYQHRPEPLGITVSALYEKLRNSELAVSSGLLRDTALDLAQILDELTGKPQPWLPGYSIRMLDGNCLAASEKRLAVHRGVAGAALPGKSLVVLDPERNLVLEVFPCADGHAQERRLLGAVSATARAGEVWIEDRNFCTLGFLAALSAKAAQVIIRQHANLPFSEVTPFVPVAAHAGTIVSEQQIRVDGRHYRRIRVHLDTPTRDGEQILYLISDLPPTIPADKIAALYRQRWTIEISFQKIEKYFKSEIETLAYPQAALFCFALALVAYNILSVMMAALEAAHEKPVQHELSGYYIALSISATFLALMQLTEAVDWRFIAHQTPTEFAAWLRETARNVSLRTLKKHPRGPKKPSSKPPHDPKQPHVSTYQLLRNKGRSL
jgi:hypothetical protein